MKIQFSTEWSYEEEVEVLVEDATDSDEDHHLVVYNDDFNTFDHVIETLMRVCKHNQQQAEQCTYLIHYKGKCKVKTGGFDELAAMRNAICERGISAEVE